ncbi:zinc/cadmium resistance protein isoform X1 [Fundulus heteroclitus]|uniref:zinc/cadmium resistance protein isoform X1 n=1 Tax=Fundulus heteroclitus TaxID=8078 RepID=UPI00165CB076|nr:zinc/cadmium resistance protein isoform X1 [Fundulus heteroclitus]
MRPQQWCMLGVTVLLLLCEIAVSQLCKSLITMVDGFHTLFILMHMALPQTEDIIRPRISSLDSSPSSPRDSFSLGGFSRSLHSEPPAELPDQSDAKQPDHDPASVVNSHHKGFSSVTPSCSLSFPKSRIHVVGVFISSLLLVSLCVSYFLEIIGFIVKPHPVQHPLLPVVVGAGSLLHKMLLFVLDWDEMLDKKAESCRHAETEPPLEINHKVCAEEESRSQEEEELSVRSKGQIAAHNCLHSGALVLCNPGSPNLPEHGCETELQLLEIGEESSGAHLKRESPRRHPCIRHPVSDIQNTSEPSSVSRSSSGWGCRWSLCLLSFVFVIQGLFTSLLALINSLVTVLVVPQLLHSSEACRVLVYLDPGLSLLAVAMLIATSLPQVYRYGMLLLQASPPHMRVSDVGRRIASVPGVQAVHDLHIWQLTESLTVASVHVHCHAGFPLSRCADLMSGVTKVLQSVGVSCSTVQPEFISSSSSFRGDGASTFIQKEDPSSLPLPPCSLACAKACASKMCCSLLEEKEEETRSTQKPPGEETNEEPPTLIIENTFL